MVTSQRALSRAFALFSLLFEIPAGFTVLAQTSSSVAFGPYPCQIAFEGRPFVGSPPALTCSDYPATFRLSLGPEGLCVDSRTGVPSWSAPTGQRHVARIVADTTCGSDTVEWILHVLPDDVPHAEILQGELIDIVVPPELAQWLRTYAVMPHLDQAYRYMRAVMGTELISGKQIFRYNPEGGTHNGNPATGGPGWWSTDPVEGWNLGALYHEVGHNFLGDKIPMLARDNWAQPYIHHLTAFLQFALWYRALEDPALFGLSDEALENYRSYVDSRKVVYYRRTARYREWLQSGGDAETYLQQAGADPYAVWSWITLDILDQYGTTAIEGSLGCFRPDGMSDEMIETADNPTRKNTLLICTLSCGAQTDLRPFLAQRGFRVDDAYYETMLPLVRDIVENLPSDSFADWVAGPDGASEYRRLLWKTDWEQACRAAKQHGAHLLSITTAQEDDWIRRRFGDKGTYWLGLSYDQGLLRPFWSSGEAVAYTNWQKGQPKPSEGKTAVCGYWFRQPGWAVCSPVDYSFSVLLERRWETTASTGLPGGPDSAPAVPVGTVAIWSW